MPEAGVRDDARRAPVEVMRAQPEPFERERHQRRGQALPEGDDQVM
ncbi:hypothetical protein [Deinococcus pimensis]